MSYGVASALQAAVYQRLAGDAGLSALVGAAVHDVVPAGPVPGTYVSLGPEDVRDRSDKTGRGAEHRFTVSVVSDAAGFQTAKAAAGAASDALLGAGLTLSRGRVVAIEFVSARARRVRTGDVRRIDMTFRARVEDDI
jgi:hypothetical protein